jgi:long-chain acyl-CoA synthetase
MRFVWHPAAVAVDAQGVRHLQGAAAMHPVLMPPRPAAAALQSAIGAPAFRIGGTGPLAMGEGVFQTLTGGSSGTPARITRSQQSWIESFRVNARLFDLGPDTRVGVPGALIHSLALYAAIEALHLGAEAHLLDGLRSDRQARAIADRAIDVLYTTPAQLKGLVAAGINWPRLRHVIVGGAKLAEADRRALSALSDAKVTEFYGAAETSFITMSDAETPAGSVGRPYPGVEIACREGVIWVRSPYLALDAAREGPARPGAAVWQDGWVAPGECGRLEDGYLWLTGRIGRRVKVADQTVQLEVIEEVLAAQPGVQAGAVIAVPDARRGHVLTACVVGDASQEPAILAALRASFGPLMAPRRLHWRASLPLLPSGKTDLAQLMQDHGGRTNG